MTYKATTIANWFINQFDQESGDVITHLKLQKLLYFSEAWCQILLNKTLFDEDMEAWAHGPVVREVFNQFRDHRWEPLISTDIDVSIDPDTEDVLLQVLDAYGDLSAKTLENMAHQDQPWKEARGEIAPEAICSNVIPKEAIKIYFIEKYKISAA